MSGPLEGIRIIEFAGQGPGPFCAMMLSDMGADVIKIDRLVRPDTIPRPTATQFLFRGRPSIAVDLKRPEGVETVLELVESADGLIEGYRPTTMERLGLGPQECLARNPRLLYGRVTGWGQSGPYAQAAGHDLNYIALAGALHPMGTAEVKPAVPLNMIGDLGGGGMLLAFGIACGIIEARSSGIGQVIDAAMVDGSALLTITGHSLYAGGQWSRERGENVLDGGAPFYNTYVRSDGELVSVGAVEPQFYAELIRLIGLEPSSLPPQMDRSEWPALRQRFAEVFTTRTQAEWCAILEHTDACFAPVLPLWAASEHPHLAERATFVEVAGERQPAPAPRFSRTPGQVAGPPTQPGEGADEALVRWGLAPEQISALREQGVLGVARG